MVARIGHAVMLEQVKPGDAVALAQSAERVGFDSVMLSDRFAPWTRHGEASFVWNVASAAAAQTTIPVHPGVVCPSYRMHPAVVAQAAATLAALFPDRHWLGIGAGELINEHVVADYWPDPAVRIGRMFEALEIIRKLLGGKEVRHSGRDFRMEQTRLWTLPDTPPPLLVATGGPITARRAGTVADGLITEGASVERVARLFERLDQGAASAGRDPDSLHRVVRLHHSWAPTDAEALDHARTHWPVSGVRFPASEVRHTRDFEALTDRLRADDFTGRMVISADPEQHRHHIQAYLDLGADEVYLHQAGPDQAGFQEMITSKVLPGLSR